MSVELPPPHDRFDPEYCKSIATDVIGFLDRYYFRAEFIGFDPPPERSRPEVPLIFAGNHSGMAFSWEAMVLIAALLRMAGDDFRRAARTLIAPELSTGKVVNPYFVDQFWHRAGGVDATLKNFDILMRSAGTNILIYPEGVHGIDKGFNHRYELQRFSTSFLRMAIKYRADIVPILTVNGEFIHPLSYSSHFLNHIVHRIGIPFIPLGPFVSLALALPWSFYFGLPAKLTYVRGRTIRVDELTDAPLEKIRPKEMHRIRDTVQARLQEELNDAVARYGQDPYHIQELEELWFENRDKLLYILPGGWPLLFHEHDRLYSERGRRTNMQYDNAAYLRALARHPKILAYHLPVLGWPLLLAQNR